MILVWASILPLATAFHRVGLGLGVGLVGLYPMLLRAMTIWRLQRIEQVLVTVHEDGLALDDQPLRAEDVVGLVLFEFGRTRPWLVFTPLGASQSQILIFDRANDALAAAEALRGPRQGWFRIPATPIGTGYGRLFTLALSVAIGVILATDSTGWYAMGFLFLLVPTLPFLLLGYARLVQRTLRTTEIQIHDHGLRIDEIDLAPRDVMEVTRT